MPINPAVRHLYGPAWRATRRRILERAGGHFVVPPGKRVARYAGDAKCERCGVPDHRDVARAAGWWLRTDRPCLNCIVHLNGRSRSFGYTCKCLGYWVSPNGQQTNTPASIFPVSIRRVVRIVITVAHLDHVAGHDTDDNLKALCQWCHLHHDQDQHKQTRSTRKDAARPLLAPAAPGSPEAWADQVCNFIERGMSAQAAVEEAICRAK